MGRARRRPVPGQDPRRGLDARRQIARCRDRQSRHQTGTDEAVLRAQRPRRVALQRRAPRPRRRRLGVARRQLAARLGKPGHRQGQGPVGDTRVRTESMDTSPVEFRTEPARYKHWRLAFDGPIATLTMDVREDGGLAPGYELKLNSYDLGVDIELYDAIQRLRFEHPEVGAVVIKSGKENVFCAGANIRMLGKASHGLKVNFCKFTNETRLAIEDACEHSKQIYLCAVNGTAAGGGYELALAADHIMLVDDRRSSVALPETPLLAVLPGTGGLTRVTDKRKVRRDLADVFCSTEEGVRGRKAVEWRLVDEVVAKSKWEEGVKARAQALAQKSARPGNGATGVTLEPLDRKVDGDAIVYPNLRVDIDRARALATVTRS